MERQDFRGRPCRAEPRRARSRRLRDPRLGAPSSRGREPPEGDADTRGDQGGVRVALMPKQIITSQSAPTTGFTDKGTPSPLPQSIPAGYLLFVARQSALDLNTRAV